MKSKQIGKVDKQQGKVYFKKTRSNQNKQKIPKK